MNQAAEVFQGALVHSKNIEQYELVPMDVDDLPPEEVLGFRVEGRPELAMRVLWMSSDRRTAVTVERMGPCRVIGHHQNEVFYFLSGHCTAKRPDGSEYDVRAGDFVCFAEGQKEEWTVHETFTKCAFYNSSKPLPYEPTP